MVDEPNFTDIHSSLSPPGRSAILPTALLVLAGIIAVITGIISVAAVARNKSLRNKFFLLLCSLFVNDAFMGFVYVSVGAKRLYQYSIGTDTRATRWSCCLESMVLYFSQTLGLYLVFMLIVDRMFSIIKPLKYKFTSKGRLTYPLIAFALGLSILEVGLMLWKGSNHSDEVVELCGTANCWPRESYAATLLAHLSISIIVVTLNILLMLVLNMKKFPQQHSNSWVAHMRNNMQAKVTKTLAVMIVNHASSHISTRLGLVILFYVTGEDPEISVIGLILRNLVVINAASHFFIYYTTSSEFRAGVIDLRRKLAGTSVAAVSIVYPMNPTT